ncbi:class I SAM-dependent methyltransferase [uncultured Gelidibacter sp.]|uniref:class I SAM-dependent methyltransferase n=1 Tax=uncultured Gelidibacter sp. TaxID=259318 RepID=UPI00262C33D4|nr:class I SAM-dependent methyltransferase [uncultured Gelidibacter sp.]
MNVSNSNQKKVYIKVKDHSVSGEDFELLLNEELGMLETFPRPSEDRLPEYYKSEDYISHTDAKRNVFEKAYHFVKGIALKRKLKLIESVVTDSKSLLDVGCGTGDFLQVAAKAGWKISGIEPNDQARAIANSKTQNSVYNTEKLFNFEPDSFDVITLWHVLEHLPNLDEHLSTFKNLLKADGTLIIAVPNYKSYDAQMYKAYWAAYDVPRHLWHFSQEAISKLATTVDLKVVEILPMKFDAFYVSLLSEKYKSGRMNYFKGFWNGWRSNMKASASGEYSSLIYVIKKA